MPVCGQTPLCLQSREIVGEFLWKIFRLLRFPADFSCGKAETRPSQSRAEAAR
jgi:hypothetical protein